MKNFRFCFILQGVYTFDTDSPAIQVDTFCIHGGPKGYITGIRGRVQCLSEEDTENSKTDLERREMIKEKCYLRFPTLPFIPKEPYDVIATDYDNFAIVSGAKDRSFVQVISMFSVSSNSINMFAQMRLFTEGCFHYFRFTQELLILGASS